MIFATLGTAQPFPRFLRRLDELAGTTDREIIVQTGRTPAAVKHCKTFDFAPSLQEYMQKADLIISHAGLGTSLELLKLNKPFILIPRLAKYKEHYDDHQVETCEILHRKYGITYFTDLEQLDMNVLDSVTAPRPYDGRKLKEFHKNIEKVIFECL